MPSSLISARIRGIRSYSPADDDSQKIEFMPLTLIVGANGTGKTTIIEALKFIISGEDPPHSDCRRNFIHTPRQNIVPAKFKDGIYASIEIEFKNSFGERCVARRDIHRTGATKTAPPPLSSGYKVGQSSWIWVHRQDDWNKVMPKLFGLPNQAILSNVILCHQEDNLWCMGESSNVKLVFDKIFGCEQYKREIKNVDDEVRQCKKDLDSAEKKSILLGENVKRKLEATENIERLTSEIKALNIEIDHLNDDVSSLTMKRQTSADRAKASESRVQEIANLKFRIKNLTERDATLRDSLSVLNYKRPAPIERPKIVTKKPAPDPIVADLNSVTDNFNKMTSLVEKMPASDDLSDLKELIDQTLVMVQDIRSRFVSDLDRPPTPPQPIEEEPNLEEIFLRDLERKRANTQRQIDENLKDLEGMRDRIIVMQKAAQDDSGAEDAKEELKAIEQQLMQVRDKRSQKSGSKSQLERELNSEKSKLSSFRNVNRDYATQLGIVAANRIVIADLEKLKKCFLESITSFHDQMIIKINELLRARWRQIYQGTDIESIELVDEPITRGKAQKSYNYHMAMRKNGIKMKMREKSSAGQRALAAIILRMTLAELLVRDFAFIALDEPTANLDLANVQALAKSIGAYVRKRTKKGANIQWIIITHDEQFLRALDEESSPFFYRIHMDRTSGCSKIVKVSSQEVVTDGGEELA